jgi:hypothetical protein
MRFLVLHGAFLNNFSPTRHGNSKLGFARLPRLMFPACPGKPGFIEPRSQFIESHSIKILLTISTLHAYKRMFPGRGGRPDIVAGWLSQ